MKQSQNNYWWLKKDISKGFTTHSQQGFYNTKAWKELRIMKLNLNPICEECERKGMVTPAQVINHIRPVTTHPDLKLELSNLESLCSYCHQLITRHDYSKYNRFNILQGRKMKQDLDDFSIEGGEV